MENNQDEQVRQENDNKPNQNLIQKKGDQIEVDPNNPTAKKKVEKETPKPITNRPKPNKQDSDDDDDDIEDEEDDDQGDEEVPQKEIETPKMGYSTPTRREEEEEADDHTSNMMR